MRARYAIGFAAALLAVVVPAGLAGASEAEFIAILNNEDASVQEITGACRALARIGSADAVPALADRLADRRVSHMARYALEAIPDASADAALLEALSALDGDELLGVIMSVGERRIEEAVGPLTEFLASEDRRRAAAAARALGRIGTVEAGRALAQAMREAPAGQRTDLTDGALRCAETLAGAGRRRAAAALYERVREAGGEVPHIRLAALRGAVKTRPQQEAISLLREALLDSRKDTFNTAVGLALEMPGQEVGQLLMGALGQLPPDRQYVVVQALGERKDTQAAPRLMELTDSDQPEELRAAALHALTAMEHDPVVGRLAELAVSGAGAVQDAARRCLIGYSGEAADAAVLALFEDANEEQRALAVEFVAQRHMAQSIALLLNAAANDAAAAVRLACIRSLRGIAGVDELPAVLDLVFEPRSEAEAEEALDVVGAVVRREAEHAQQTGENVSPALLHVLNGAANRGGPEAVQQAIQTHLSTLTAGPQS